MDPDKSGRLCPTCDGHGTTECRHCDGAGEVEVTRCVAPSRRPMTETIRCGECKGKGKV